MQNAHKPLDVDFLIDQRRVSAGDAKNLRFRLTDPRTGEPRTDVEDATVMYYRAPNFGRRTIAAEHLGDGIYEVTLDFKQAGAYYVYVESRSLKMNYRDLDYLTLTAVRSGGS